LVNDEYWLLSTSMLFALWRSLDFCNATNVAKSTKINHRNKLEGGCYN